MKHDILFIKDDKIIQSKFYGTSFDVFHDFIQNYDFSKHLIENDLDEIQLDLFYETVFVIYLKSKHFVAYQVSDLASILLIKDIAIRLSEYNFDLFYQDGSNSEFYVSPLKLFNRLLLPLEEGILKKQLTLFK